MICPFSETICASFELLQFVPRLSLNRYRSRGVLRTGLA